MNPRFERWLVLGAVVAAGCASSSSSASSGLHAVPMIVPQVGSAEGQENVYTGMLVNSRPGLGPSMGWRIRNQYSPGSVPVDVTKVATQAQNLAGKVVTINAHSALLPGGRMVLAVDSIKD